MKRANGQLTPAVAPNSRCEGIAAARAALHENVSGERAMRCEKPPDWKDVPPSLDFADSLRKLGEQLQLKYSQVLAEPMPDEFHSLLKELHRKTDRG
jgi:hypothetical protein